MSHASRSHSERSQREANAASGDFAGEERRIHWTPDDFVDERPLPPSKEKGQMLFALSLGESVETLSALDAAIGYWSARLDLSSPLTEDGKRTRAILGRRVEVMRAAREKFGEVIQ